MSHSQHIAPTVTLAEKRSSKVYKLIHNGGNSTMSDFSIQHVFSSVVCTKFVQIRFICFLVIFVSTAGITQ